MGGTQNDSVVYIGEATMSVMTREQLALSATEETEFSRKNSVSGKKRPINRATTAVTAH